MDGDSDDFRRFQRRGLLSSFLGSIAPDGQTFHFVQYIPSIQDLAKHRVKIVQVGLLFVQDEKLGFVGVGTTVRHAQPTPTVVFVVRMELVGKGHVVPPNTGLFPRDVCGVSSLDHKALDVAMENCSVVLARSRQRQEVKGGSRACITENLAFEISDCRMDCHRHDDDDDDDDDDDNDNDNDNGGSKSTDTSLATTEPNKLLEARSRLLILTIVPLYCCAVGCVQQRRGVRNLSVCTTVLPIYVPYMLYVRWHSNSPGKVVYC